jgi:hypothetical protein
MILDFAESNILLTSIIYSVEFLDFGSYFFLKIQLLANGKFSSTRLFLLEAVCVLIIIKNIKDRQNSMKNNKRDWGQ